MSNITVNYKFIISSNEAANGTKRLLTRKGKRLEVTIPAGVKTGSLVKLSGALQITDGYYGDILIQIKIKSQLRVVLATATIVGLFIIISSIVIIYSVINSGGATRPTVSPSESTPTLSPTPTVKPTLIYENGAIHVGGDNKPIELVNNPNATNPTYTELIVFIRTDATDVKGYVEEGFMAYVCSDFAEDVHNNAEAAGIRTAWVSVDFYGGVEGHALNAFETTDRGVVYIDCTGEGFLSQLGSKKYNYTSWDKVAYVEIGREYGVIHIAYAKSLSYSFYEEYMQKRQEFETRLEAYNREVERYNQEISGKVYTIGSTESARIAAWEDRLEEEEQALDKLAKELGESYYEQLGVVKDIHIHW